MFINVLFLFAELRRIRCAMLAVGVRIVLVRNFKASFHQAGDCWLFRLHSACELRWSHLLIASFWGLSDAQFQSAAFSLLGSWLFITCSKVLSPRHHRVRLRHCFFFLFVKICVYLMRCALFRKTPPRYIGCRKRLYANAEAIYSPLYKGNVYVRLFAVYCFHSLSPHERYISR